MVKRDLCRVLGKGLGQAVALELFQSVVWHLAAKGWAIEQVVDELARHPNGIGRKYADRLHDEVTRSYEKWRQQKYTAATGSAAPITPRCSIPEMEWSQQALILTGIVATPFLRTDGSICEQPGYDAASGMLFKPDEPGLPTDSAS